MKVLVKHRLAANPLNNRDKSLVLRSMDVSASKCGVILKYMNWRRIEMSPRGYDGCDFA